MESSLFLLLRTTLFLTATGIVCYLALRNTGDRMPRLSRFLWLTVLLTGWFWIRPVIEIPWKETVQEPAPAITATPEPVPMPIFEPKPGPVFETATNPEPIAVVAAESVDVSKKIEWKPSIFKTVFAVWLGGMVVSIFLSAAGYFRFLSLLRKAVPASDDFAGPWRRLLERHGIDARSIPMFVSESRAGNVESLGPALIRLPTEYRLIVPRELWSELSEAGRSGILKHELEHFRRRDVWKSFFVRILALPHWFNPVAHLAVHRFEEAAELLCDRAAFDLERESVLEFARTLLLLHENAPTHFVARQSIFGRGLKHRVACLLHDNSNENKKVSTMKKILLLTGTVVVLAACLFRFEFVENIVAQTNGDPSETQEAKQTIRLAEDDVLVFDDGKWKNKKSLETIPVGTVVEGSRGTFRLDAVGEYGTVTRLSGGGATGTGKHIEWSDGGNAITTSVLSPEEMKNVIVMDEKDVFVFDNGVWTNEKTGKEIEPGSYVAGTRGAFRLEKKDDIGSIVLVSGLGAIGSGKYIRWSNGGNGFSGGKSAKNVSKFPMNDAGKLLMVLAPKGDFKPKFMVEINYKLRPLWSKANEVSLAHMKTWPEKDDNEQKFLATGICVGSPETVRQIIEKEIPELSVLRLEMLDEKKFEEYAEKKSRNINGQVSWNDATQNTHVIVFAGKDDFKPTTSIEILMPPSQAMRALPPGDKPLAAGWTKSWVEDGRLVGALLTNDPKLMEETVSKLPGFQVLRTETLTEESLEKYLKRGTASMKP